MNCNAGLEIADDWGDNHATMHCQLEEGNEGPRREAYGKEPQSIVVTWTVDERKQETLNSIAIV